MHHKNQSQSHCQFPSSAGCWKKPTGVSNVVHRLLEKVTKGEARFHFFWYGMKYLSETLQSLFEVPEYLVPSLVSHVLLRVYLDWKWRGLGGAKDPDSRFS